MNARVLAALLMAGADVSETYPGAPDPEPRRRSLSPSDLAAIRRAEERRAARRARNLRNKEGEK